MKKRCIAAVLACLLLCGCGRTEAAETESSQTLAVTEAVETIPATTPADGDPGDVTCKGSYTASVDASAVVAEAGDAQLTNGELQILYWAAAAQYRQSGGEVQPDFEKPLDTQSCGIDSTVNSWQQYFLREALTAWHTAQALNRQSKTLPNVTEEAYQPADYNHEKYMTGMPATEVLYGYEEYFEPNSMHQAYLDSLPQTLDALAREKGYADASAMAQEAFGTGGEALASFARNYNYAYMYFTELSYAIEPSGEDLTAYWEENKASFDAEGTYVDIRHILLVPEEPSNEDRNSWEPEVEPDPVAVAADGTVTCSEARWTACEETARNLLAEWNKNGKGTEATFAELANKNSKDSGTALDGGAYHRVGKGQLMEALDAWCFDSIRQAGDTTILRSPYGIHILYFSGSTPIAQAQAEDSYYKTRQAALIEATLEESPMTVTYSAITLGEGEAAVSLSDLLYADIAHERYPEIPLYLQQDYPRTMYGGWKITSNGCGITSFAMIATYMTDTEWTPPELCALYGKYSHRNGTDGMMFNKESPVLGFYLVELTYEPAKALEALTEGHQVISLQHPGYWTRGGHYIVLERLNENGMVQVRDSNIFNYGRIATHAQDEHTWQSITSAGRGFWIFDYKITNIPACVRCGESEAITDAIVMEDYTCHKCRKALLRRDTFLNCGV